MAQKRKQPTPARLHRRGRKPVAREVALRTVRPRPLHYDEKLRVLWPGDGDLERIDGGAFARWLAETEAARQSGVLSAVGSCQAQVVIVGSSMKPKAPQRAEQHPEPVIMGTASMLAERLGGKTIKVPKFRLLPKRTWLQEPEASLGPGGTHAGEEAAYFRHRDQTQDEIDLRIEYDLDSEDEEWLAKRKKKGGLEPLSEDDLERLIDSFEKAKHAELASVRARMQHHQGSSPKSVEEHSPAEIYPVSKAIEAFGTEFSSLTIRAVHNFWAKKAAASKLPLLQRFWYDKPWARLVARSNRAQMQSDSDSDDGIPFQGKDTPRHIRGRPLDVDEVEDRLHAARQDLERLRTIADRVRRREKFKRRELHEWRREWQERVFLARKQKKVGKLSKKKAAATQKAAEESSGKPGRKRRGPHPAARPVKKGSSFSKEAPEIVRKTTPSQPALPLNGKRSTSLGGGIVSAVVDQLWRLGSWRLRGEDSPRSRVKQELKAAHFEGPPGKASKAAQALPITAPASMTRQQEQAALDAAIQLSLEEQKQPTARAVPPKQVRFARQARTRLLAPGEQPKKRKTLLAPPEGFKRRISAIPGKRRTVVWTSDCKHATLEFRSVAKLPTFFREHGSCRPGWKAFKQRPRESQAAYIDRLRQTFGFNVAAAERSEVPVVSLHKRSQQLGSGLQKRSRTPAKSVSRRMSAQEPVKLSKKRKAQAGKRVTDKAAASRPHKARKLRNIARDESVTSGISKAEAERALHRRAGRSGLDREAELRGKTGQNRAETPESKHEIPTAQLEMADAEVADTLTSSSGSDTCVPADSDRDSDGEDGQILPGKHADVRRRGVRLTRRNGAIASRLQLHLPKVPLEWRGRAAQEAASDASSFSEGSGPNLFSQQNEPRTEQLQRGLKSVRLGRPRVATRGKGRLVARARQRAKRAALQR